MLNLLRITLYKAFIYPLCVLCAAIFIALAQDKDNTPRNLTDHSPYTIKKPNYIVADKTSDIYIIEDGHILRFDGKTNALSRLFENADTGSTTANKQTIATKYRLPMRLSTCRPGSLIVSDINNSVFEFNTVTESYRQLFADSRDAENRKFRRIAGIACNINSNLFITDDMGHHICRWDRRTGNVTIVAGTGQNGFCGDGGPAVNACFSFPMCLAINSRGDLFVADYQNHRVRKIDAITNTINTVAGNGEAESKGDNQLAIQASLHFPEDIAIDKQGNLFIVEPGRHTVRRVDAQTGIIIRFAGTGEKGYSGDGGLAIHAQLSNPGSVTIDDKGNLYIADWSNNCIRRVDANTGIITTVLANR